MDDIFLQKITFSGDNDTNATYDDGTIVSLSIKGIENKLKRIKNLTINVGIERLYYVIEGFFSYSPFTNSYVLPVLDTLTIEMLPSAETVVPRIVDLQINHVNELNINLGDNKISIVLCTNYTEHTPVCGQTVIRVNIVNLANIALLGVIQHLTITRGVFAMNNRTINLDDAMFPNKDNILHILTTYNEPLPPDATISSVLGDKITCNEVILQTDVIRHITRFLPTTVPPSLAKRKNDKITKEQARNVVKYRKSVKADRQLSIDSLREFNENHKLASEDKASSKRNKVGVGGGRTTKRRRRVKRYNKRNRSKILRRN